jgi:two-component system, NtrC family, sensor histidine kinase HydH
VSTPPSQFALDQLPVAALATRDGVFVAVNRIFELFTGWNADDMIGHTLPELLGKLVAPGDHALLERLSRNRALPEPRRQGAFWCRVLSGTGDERPMRVEWRLDDNGRDALIVLLDAHPEAFGQEVTAALTRVAGALSRCATEEEVLQRAVEGLCERGFTASVLLWDASHPLLRYGPSRTPDPPSVPLNLPPLPREILSRLNPSFLDRRAAFFQDGLRLVREAYSEPVAERLLAFLPAQRMVQAPLFLGEEPYGALVVTGDALSPLVATALELFAELVGKALEAVRLRRELVERERMAALGEAAAVMAHEVRNPVGSIMNAVVLLERDRSGGPDGGRVLAIIAEEAKRLALLVNQLLELGRPLHPRPRAVSMEDLIQRAVDLLSARGELSSRSLDMPTTAGTMTWLDPTLAELALVNVIQNALQSTSGDGRVGLSVEASDAWVRCVVTDDGPGIPDDIRERLGQPFVTTRATGTGVGLAVVHRIMEASGGRVLFETAEPGGAQVGLEFPRPREE